MTAPDERRCRPFDRCFRLRRLIQNPFPPDSVGLVTPRHQAFETPVTLLCGRVLPRWELVYETYGELNAARSVPCSSAILCPAIITPLVFTVRLTRPGWWDTCSGPGKPIDTNRFFVVSLNNVGGCNGGTGPVRSILPAVPTADFRWSPYAIRLLRRRNWRTRGNRPLGRNRQRQPRRDAGDAMDDRLPRSCRAALLIACASRLSAQNIAFNEIARQAILSVRTSPTADTSIRLRRAV